MERIFKKILIANRGEIALRIIRACKVLGISTVGIYSNIDSNALWIAQCDEKWPLNSDSLSESYLNINRIIEIALHSKVDAIHPGYGFLAENYLFAQACRQNNLVFIGPDSGVLKLAGDKTACHLFVQTLGIPVPARITGSIPELHKKAADISFPVMVKANAGGGGRGIRIAGNENELMDAIQTTSSEALQYFGDQRIYIEEYIPDCRHIEIQILADSQGNIRHFFERECSIQRRHQKIIEESPSAWLNERMRQNLFETAILIAKSLNYTGAGTIEFLADDKNRFFFLEINPRIQVEHGITELLTGIDLVAAQIRIAAGQPVSFEPIVTKPAGHAMEVRICADDPENDLLPSPGNVRNFYLPVQSGVRIDTAVSDNTMIPAEYDNLLAKVMVIGENRKQSIEIMQELLSKSFITGIRHNMVLIQQILADSEFSINRIHTGYLENKLPSFLASIHALRKKTSCEILAITAALTLIHKNDVKMVQSPWQHGFWRNVRQIRFRSNGFIISLDYQQGDNESTHFFVNAWKGIVSDVKIFNYGISYLLNGSRYHFWYAEDSKGMIAMSDGLFEYFIERFIMKENVEYAYDTDVTVQQNVIIAPQPGTVMEIKVKVGQLVIEGDNLVVIESMKLENTILAGISGQVKKIAVKKGDKVKKDEPMIYLQ